MHLICLGETKKLILLWMKGPLRVRLPSSKINQLSKLLVLDTNTNKLLYNLVLRPSSMH